MPDNKADNSISNGRVVFLGAVTTVFIFLIGFGAMWLFWLNAKTSYTGDKGFFFWRAATWGDGLCLSVLVGSLVAYRAILGRPRKKHRRASYILGTLAGLGGAAIQASWVISDTTVPNWTIEPHRFLPSGWYHAGYFVFMFFIITMLLVQVFFARRCADMQGTIDDSNPLSKLMQSFIWFSGLGYWFMHNIDDRYTQDNFLGLTVETIVIFAVVALLFCILSKKPKPLKQLLYDVKADSANIVFGSLNAVILGLSVYYNASDYLTAAICCAFAMALVKPNTKKPVLTVFNLVKVSLPASLLALLVSGMQSHLFIILVAALAIVVPVIFSPKEEGGRLRIMGVSLLFLALAPRVTLLTASGTEGFATLVSIIASSVTNIFCALYIPHLFKEHIIKEEGSLNKSTESISNAVYTVYTIMLAVGLGTVVVFIRSLRHVFFEYIAPTQSVDFSTGFTNMDLIAISALSLSILCLTYIRYFVKSRGKMVVSMAVALTVVSYTCLITFLLNIKMPQFISYNHPLGIVSLWIITWASIFVMFGFYDNTVSLRGRENKAAKVARVFSTIVFIGCLASCILSVFSIDLATTYSSSVPRLGASLFAILCSALILPTLCCSIIEIPKHRDKDITSNTPTSGVLHIGLLMSGVIAIGASVPLFIASFCISDSAIMILTFLYTFIAIYAVIFGLAIFSLKNNVKHMADRIKDANNEPHFVCALFALNRHLRRQNVAVILMLSPYLLVPFLGSLFVDYIKKGEGSLTSVLNEMRDKYIPVKYDPSSGAEEG